jgi:glutathione S-transferase
MVEATAMSHSAKPELISFKLCPYVQRSVITLLEKGVDYDLTYIDLADPPQWFLDISPLGKVPALRVGDEVLFESAVINEYLDEVNPPSMHPADPLHKAQNRAWIEFASTLIGDQYQLMVAADEAQYQKALGGMQKKLGQLQQRLDDGPYFNGEDFSLMDAAIAPVFMRLHLLDQWSPLEGLYDNTPKVAAWHEALLARPSVQASVVEEFAPELRHYIGKIGGYSAQRFGGENENAG